MSLEAIGNNINDFMYRWALRDPFINPIGCYRHWLNPSNNSVSKLDNPILNFFNGAKSYANDTPTYLLKCSREQIMEFYARGGKGVKF